MLLYFYFLIEGTLYLLWHILTASITILMFGEPLLSKIRVIWTQDLSGHLSQPSNQDTYGVSNEGVGYTT